MARREVPCDLGPTGRMSADAFRDLEQVFVHSYDELFVVNEKGVILWVNNACERLHGVRAEELQGKSFLDFERGGLFRPVSVVGPALRDKRRVSLIQEADDCRLLIATASPIMDEYGNVTRIIGNAIDLTDLADLNEMLNLGRRGQQYGPGPIAPEALLSNADGIVACSQGMKSALALARRAARSDCTVLLRGESGVGKDVLARFIHRASHRRTRPFIKINCGAIPENLLESELFGYEEGAFTGAARSGKAGLFEVAWGGTLFLDEIAELPLASQAKLLQVIDEKKFRRVGGTRDLKVDVRYIAATNQNLPEYVRNGRFREDLFYRLNVVPITIPPLRERQEDVPPLTAYYLERANLKYRSNKTLGAEVLELFKKHEWPGNVRELENLIERLVVTVEDDLILLHHLPEEFHSPLSKGSVTIDAVVPLKQAVSELERQLVEMAWRMCGNTYKVGRLLGISQPTAARKVRKYIVACPPS